LIVSSGGSLARGSKRKLPSRQVKAWMTTSSPCPDGLAAWKRWPKRKYNEAVSLWLSRARAPVARSVCMVWSRDARLDSCSVP
jgi:hypothetical protein